MYKGILNSGHHGIRTYMRIFTPRPVETTKAVNNVLSLLATMHGHILGLSTSNNPAADMPWPWARQHATKPPTPSSHLTPLEIHDNGKTRPRNREYPELSDSHVQAKHNRPSPPWRSRLHGSTIVTWHSAPLCRIDRASCRR